MVIYLACLSNLYHFSLIRASKIFVIGSDCLLSSIQQGHDNPCSGLSPRRWETKNQTKTYKRVPEVLCAASHTSSCGIKVECVRTGLECQIQI